MKIYRTIFRVGIIIGMTATSLSATPIDVTPTVEASPATKSNNPSQFLADENTTALDPTENLDPTSDFEEIGAFNTIENTNFSGVKSLQELIESASAAPPIQKPRQFNQGSRTNSQRENFNQGSRVKTGDTVRDVARSLVNIAGRGQGGNTAPSIEPRGANNGASVFTDVMNLRMSPDAYQAIARIISPELTTNGASLNLLGIRRFTVVFSPLTKKIGVSDSESDKQATFSYSNTLVTPRLAVGTVNTPGKPKISSRRFQQQNSISEMLYTAREFVSSYVFHPFALIAFMIIGIFWLMFKLRRNMA